MLQAINLTKRYGPHEALDRVSLTAAPGQITAVIGPSGGGKSTLMRTLSLLDQPTSGSIEINGRTYRFPDDARKAIDPPWPGLGVVFQQLFLWPHLTLRQNVLLPLQLRAKSADLTRANDLIDYFDLNEAADRYPNETSLGQRQRAALIRALVLEPQCLLLDEITSALDVEHVGKVLNLLRDLRSKGVTVIVVTHLLGFARSSADQVLFLDHGRVVEIGPATMLGAPSTERLRKFVALAESAT